MITEFAFEEAAYVARDACDVSTDGSGVPGIAGYFLNEIEGVIPLEMSYSLRAATSVFNFSIMIYISFGERYTLAAALFLIFFAREANWRV